MPVRDAVPEDFDAIQELNRQIFEYEHQHCDSTVNVEYPYQDTGIEFLTNIVRAENTHSGLVYEENGKILGYASLRVVAQKDLKHRNDILQIQLQTLCVDQEYRAKGVGKKLVEAVKARGRELGANRLKVVALANNKNARQFYKMMGFSELEIVHELIL